MPITIKEIIESRQLISENLILVTVEITVDDFDPPYTKQVTLKHAVDKDGGMFKKNLQILIDSFIDEIKQDQAIRAIDITKHVDSITTASNEKHGKLIEDIKAVGKIGTN